MLLAMEFWKGMLIDVYYPRPRAVAIFWAVPKKEQSRHAPECTRRVQARDLQGPTSVAA